MGDPMAKKSRLGERYKEFEPVAQDDLVLQDLQKNVDTIDIEYVDPKTLAIHPENRKYFGGFAGDEYEAIKADVKRTGKILSGGA